MNEFEYVLGIDLGGTYTRAGIVDGACRILHSEITRTAQVMEDPAGLVGWIRGYRERCGYRVDAVSIGLPAVLNKDRTTVLSAPNVPALDNVDIVGQAQEALGVPVLIEKDAVMLLYYDLYDNAIPVGELSTGIYFGTGIGNAVVIHGLPLVGSNGAACELGHMPVLGREELCSCGNRGCIELLASGNALRALTEEAFPGEDISTAFARHGDDPRLRQFVEAMAVPVATEINLLDPAYVILGGGVAAMQDFPKEALLEQIMRRVRKPIPAQTTKILYAKPSQSNGIVGAALYARQKSL